MSFRQLPSSFSPVFTLERRSTELALRLFFSTGGCFQPNSLQAEKVISSFQPYADVWSLVGAVRPFVTTTARAPVTTLDTDTISADHASMKQRYDLPARLWRRGYVAGRG